MVVGKPSEQIMNNKPTGGSAFPMHWSTKEANINVVLENKGMTLRDYFAAKAMQGLLAGTLKSSDLSLIARDCYQMADAMLKAREA
jgi:hypothetical protein